MNTYCLVFVRLFNFNFNFIISVQGLFNSTILTVPFAKLIDVGAEAVGNKAYYLGKLSSIKLPVPNGFVITSYAFKYFLDFSNISGDITNELSKANPFSSISLENASKRIRNKIIKCKFPNDLSEAIIRSYANISGFTDSYVAVRSSQVENKSGGPYEGRYATYLNVRGKEDVLEKVKYVWASVFLPENIFYSLSQNDKDFSLGVIVQKMIQAEASGLVFTRNPVDNDDSKVSDLCVLGLGEALMNGSLTPDTYIIDKLSSKILEKKVVAQDWMLVRRGRVKSGEDSNCRVKVGQVWSMRQKLDDKYIAKLVKVAVAHENMFGRPFEIEWAYEGGRIWIVQAKEMSNLTIENDSWKNVPTFTALKTKIEASPKVKDKIELLVKKKNLDRDRKVISGIGKSPGVTSGKVLIVKNINDLSLITPGTIIVVDVLKGELSKNLTGVVGIITDYLSNDAFETIVSKSLNIPCVAGTNNATEILKNGEFITIDGMKGEVVRGVTKEGRANSEIILNTVANEIDPIENAVNENESFTSKHEDHLVETIKTATKVYANVSNLLDIGKLQFNVADGVASLNSNDIIKHIAVHPRSVFGDEKTKLSFVKSVASFILKVAKRFEKKAVIYRLSDLTTSDYAHLSMGEKYEKTEINPYIGLRGASRYISYPEELELELEALKIVRNKENLKNVSIAIPFVRTLKELKEIKSTIAGFGLRRSSTFKIFVVAQVPSMLFRIEKFINFGIDGVIIDIYSIAKIIFAIDNELEIQGYLNHPSLMWVLERIIKECNRAKIHSQLLLRNLDKKFVKKAVNLGVLSIAVNEKDVYIAKKFVSETEADMIIKKKR